MRKKTLLSLAIIWTILIVVLSLISFSQTKSILPQIPNKDKVIHFVFYFVFVCLWGEFLLNRKAIQNRTFFLLGLLAICLGGTIEVLQDILTEYRTAEWADFLANSLGAILGCFVILVRKKMSLR